MTATPCQTKPDLWFSEAQADRDYAKALCRSVCPVRQQCLRIAMDSSPRPQHGIWGGYTARTVQKMAAAA